MKKYFFKLTKVDGNNSAYKSLTWQGSGLNKTLNDNIRRSQQTTKWIRSDWLAMQQRRNKPILLLFVGVGQHFNQTSAKPRSETN